MGKRLKVPPPTLPLINDFLKTSCFVAISAMASHARALSHTILKKAKSEVPILRVFIPLQIQFRFFFGANR